MSVGKKGKGKKVEWGERTNEMEKDEGEKETDRSRLSPVIKKDDVISKAATSLYRQRARQYACGCTR